MLCCSVMHFCYLFWLTVFYFFFFNDTATTEIYTLSLHDALPISHVERRNPDPHAPLREIGHESREWRRHPLTSGVGLDLGETRLVTPLGLFRLSPGHRDRAKAISLDALVVNERVVVRIELAARLEFRAPKATGSQHCRS